MIEVIRIVELQADLTSYRATQNEEKALQLELLIELTKPKNIYPEWDILIASPFRYSPPHPSGRFRPPFLKQNVFYGGLSKETTFYEYAFHFMRQRIHLKGEPESGLRTLFAVNANDHEAVRINQFSHYKKIMDKNDYSFSHQFVIDHPEITFILYPSCRDPNHGENAAIRDISHLDKNVKWETSVKFFYDYKKKQLTWIDYKFHINWKEVN